VKALFHSFSTEVQPGSVATSPAVSSPLDPHVRWCVDSARAWGAGAALTSPATPADTSRRGCRLHPLGALPLDRQLFWSSSAKLVDYPAPHRKRGLRGDGATTLHKEDPPRLLRRPFQRAVRVGQEEPLRSPNPARLAHGSRRQHPAAAAGGRWRSQRAGFSSPNSAMRPGAPLVSVDDQSQSGCLQRLDREHQALRADAPPAPHAARSLDHDHRSL
jgi:hypothetical protein